MKPILTKYYYHSRKDIYKLSKDLYDFVYSKPPKSLLELSNYLQKTFSREVKSNQGKRGVEASGNTQAPLTPRKDL